MVDVNVALSHRFVPQSICLALMVCLIWQMYAGIVSLYTIDTIFSVHHGAPRASVGINQGAMRTALNEALFGDYVPNNLNEADVKQSRLDLSLVGIMFSEDNNASHVIIRSAGGREQTYHVGDSLPGGATIKRITEDGVLILRNGALERITLPKTGLVFEPPAKPLEISK